MGRFDATKATIDANIKSNGNQEITGDILNSVMKGMVDATDAELTQLSEEVASNGVLIEDLQNTKIDRENDDYYPKMAVGLADNLAGVDVVDSQINFRRSGGGAITDGVARIETIKGNSVVWNQLYNRTPLTTSGMTMTIDGNTTIINGVTTGSFFGIKAGVRVPANKMLMVVQCLANPDGLSFNVADLNSATTGINVTASAPNGYVFYTGTYRANGNTLGIQRLGDVGTAFNNVKIVVSLYDLTKMFGSGNEPTTIEEFYQRIPMGVDLNAYNEGEVIHMDVQSIESVGVNQWDEEWEEGAIKADGTMESFGTRRTTSFIEVLPNTTYYQYGPSSAYNGRYVVYDEDKNIIFADVSNGVTLASKEFKTPANARYVRITFGTSYGTTYNHDICINISDASINGKYFPYIKRQEDLSLIRKYFPDGMKSAGTAHDAIRYNKASGKWEYSKGRMKEVDMGSLYYERKQYGDIYVFEFLVGGYAGTSLTSVMSPMYTTKASNASALQNMEMRGSNSPTYLRNDAYATGAELKAAMQGVILYYEAAEWEWVELDEADQFKDLDYKVWNAGTEKAIAEGKSAPLAADITYGFNAIGKIKELESLVAALRAKVGI